MKKNILITGASGNVGIELVNFLKKKRKPFLAAVRDIEGTKSILGSAVDYVYFDFERPETYDKAFAGVYRLVLIYPPSLTNLSSIYSLIDYAKSIKIEHIIFISIMGVQFSPLSPHFKIEKYLKASKVPFSILRPSFFMQNFNSFFTNSIKNENEFLIPVGKGKISFVDTRDIVEVINKIVGIESNYGKIYTLTGGQSLDFFEVADIFSNILDKAIIYSNPSSKEYKKIMMERGYPLSFIQVTKSLFFSIKIGMKGTITNDIELILKKPPITLEQYIEDYGEQWKQSPSDFSIL